MNTLTSTMSAHGYITYTCLGWLTVKNKMVFGLVDRENKMYTWLVIPKKQDTNETVMTRMYTPKSGIRSETGTE